MTRGAHLARLSPVEVRILRLLELGGDWKSKAVALELGADRNVVSRALLDLCEAGLIDRVSWGVYRIHREAAA